MSQQKALSDLALHIDQLSQKVDVFWWRLSGSHPNSLCRFLGITDEEMKSLLRRIGIYHGENDHFKRDFFEQFATICCGGDFSHYKHKTMAKGDYFLKLGKGRNEAKKPKDMYDVSTGSLVVFPVEEEHFINIRTKNQRGPIPKLLEATEKEVVVPKDEPKKGRQKSPREVLLDYLRELLGTIKPGVARKIKRLILDIVDDDIQKLTKSIVAKLESMGETKEDIPTPERIESAPVPITPIVANNLAVELEEELEADPKIDEAATADRFILSLKEEALLQSLLHKRISENNERVFPLKHKNGRRLLVVCPPDSQTASKFLEEANKTKWIDTMLNTEERRRGMLTYLAKNVPEEYARVGQKRHISMQTVGLDTYQTLALCRVLNTNDLRMKKLRSFVKHIAQVNFKQSSEDVRRIDDSVGLSRTEDAVFGEYVHEWASQNSKDPKKKTKPPETVEFWNSSLMNEIAAEVDMYHRHLFEQDKEKVSASSIDCEASGFDNPGITILIGGDHGDKNCPISAKINLSPPQQRKQIGKLNYKCPMVKFASVSCSKDDYELMEATVAPGVRDEVKKLQNSAILTLYDKKNVRSCFESYVVPIDINENTTRVQRNGDNTELHFKTGSDNQPKHIVLTRKLSNLPYFQLGWSVTVSRFNELFIGDLAFLAMSIGMNNSSGKHCLMCMSPASKFNCSHDDLKKRTKESLSICPEKYILKSRTNKSTANWKGVNSKGLLEIDPQRIIVPMLHCPMGLVDKILETFLNWVNFEVEKLTGDYQKARSIYNLSKEQKAQAEATLSQTQTLANENKNDKEVQKLLDDAKERLTLSSQEVAKAKEKFKEIIKRHNARKASCRQLFEVIYRKCGIKREHYHGGKFNGVNCIRIMAKATELFKDFQDVLLKNKSDHVEDDTIKDKCSKFARLLGTLDAIWSKVRGIESGLLPTNEQLRKLNEAIKSGKAQWLDLGLTTLQPKWHLTFDGHLYEQVQKYGGIADKADDSIEHFHQVLKQLRDRYRGTVSYKMRENCIRRELRRRRCPKIQKIVDDYEEGIKQSTTTKRALEARERQEDKKRVKEEKRDAFVSNTNVGDKP